MYWLTPFLKVVSVLAALHAAPAADFSGKSDSSAVLPAFPRYGPPQEMMPDYLARAAAAHEARRDAEIAAIRNVPQLQAWQGKTRARLIELLGGLPAKTPLNARVTGVLDRGDYRVEKIVYESQPEHYVTANFYVPAWKRHSPAFIAPVGHWLEGKAFEDYQRLGMEMARRGYALFVYDPPGQGERLEHLDPITGQDRGGSKPTNSHSIAGHQCFIAGDSLARYFLWDGIRAIDYLQSRPDVDPERIGCIGASGGGGMTRLISAIDERVKIAIPVAAAANKGGAGGEGDGEGVIPGQVAAGIWAQDLIWLLPPRPLLNAAVTGDRGKVWARYESALASVNDVKRAYRLFGLEDAAAAIEAEGRHGIVDGVRAAVYQFVDRHWGGDTELRPVAVGEGELEEPRDLWATESGQVALSLGGLMVFDLNRQRVDDARSKEQARPVAREAIRRFLDLPDAVRPVSVRSARGEGGAHRTEKLVIETEPGIVVPALVFSPAQAGRFPAILIVDDRGKAESAEPGGWMEQMVRTNRVVMSIDVRGVGETAPAERAGPRRPNNIQLLYQLLYRDFLFSPAAGIAKAALNLGRPLLAMRIHDLLAAIDTLAARPDVGDDLRVVGLGEGGVLAMFAGALDDRVREVIAWRPIVDFNCLVVNRHYAQPASLFVPEILMHFDLPGIAASIASRRVLLVNAVDELGRPLPASVVQARYAAASNTTIKLMDDRSGVPALALRENP